MSKTKGKIMTETIGRVVDGVATTNSDLIQSKKCPCCDETIKRRAWFCKLCDFHYTKDEFRVEQEAFSKLEEKMKREKSAGPSS